MILINGDAVSYLYNKKCLFLNLFTESNISMKIANQNPFTLEANNKKFFSDLEKYNCKAASTQSRSVGRHIRRGFLVSQSASCPKIEKLLIASTIYS